METQLLDQSALMDSSDVLARTLLDRLPLEHLMDRALSYRLNHMVVEANNKVKEWKHENNEWHFSIKIGHHW